MFGEPAQLSRSSSTYAGRGAGDRRIPAHRCLGGAHIFHVARAFSVGELELGPYARIAVSDDGPGFSEEVGERLSSRFHDTPGRTRLGLATVRKIVRDHDGAIESASAQGKGAAEVSLPPPTPTSTTMRGEPAAPLHSARGKPCHRSR